MKGWQLHSFGDFRLEDVPVPQVKPRWVLVKVKVVQPSVTDTEKIEGVAVSQHDRVSRMLKEGKRIQPGHEFCGQVVELGDGVTTLRVGDRVSTPGHMYCGQCVMCRSGEVDQCLSEIGLMFEIPGAFAEYVCIPEWGLVKIPDGPTDNEVATLQPLSACVSYVRSARIEMGESIVVLGQGVIGLGCLQIARITGGGLLIGVDIRRENLELASKCGADMVIDAAKTDPVEEVKRLTDGKGADVVFDAAGGSSKHELSGFETAQQAFKMVRRGGKVIQAAVLEGTMSLDAPFVKGKSIRYIFPDGGGHESMSYAAFLVASKRVLVEPQITHILQGLENLPEAMKITANKAAYRATNPAQIVV
ncbi:zinc-binding dehydrogenase [Chloroflexota bacterium]